jgi:hypothetical protein
MSNFIKQNKFLVIKNLEKILELRQYKHEYVQTIRMNH